MDYKKILNKHTNKFLKNMLFQGANNASLMIYTNKKISFYESTSSKWQDFYSSAKESQKCHIAQLGIELVKQNRDFSIIWNSITPLNDESEYLNEKREQYQHCNGISICNRLSDNSLFGIILTGKRHDTNFATQVIKNKGSFSNEVNYIKMLTNAYIQQKSF
jgi:hypothetical protein